MNAVTVCEPQPRTHKVGAATIDAHVNSMRIMYDEITEICGPRIADEYGDFWDPHLYETKVPKGLRDAYTRGTQWGNAMGIDWDLTITEVSGVTVESASSHGISKRGDQ